MKLKRSFFLFFSLFSILHFNADAVEVHKWTGTPININLKINQQRLIRLPDNALFRLPSSSKGLVSAEMAAGILYITPHRNFQNIPLDLKVSSTGEIVKLNVSAFTNVSNFPQIDEDVRIVLPWENKIISQKDSKKNSSNTSFSEKVSPQEFIRYAAIRDFEPERLWEKNSKIREYGVPSEISLKELFYGESTGVFDVKINKVYQSGNQFLTVLSLRNSRNYPVNIKFDDIAIDFTYASVPEPYYALGSLGTNQDFSYLYLITERPIAELIKAVDPSAILKR